MNKFTTAARFALIMGVVVITTGCSVTEAKQDAKTIATKIEVRVKKFLARNHHTVIVPGYGAPVKGNPTYQKYIEDVATFVADEKNKVNSVVFTGGYSTLKDNSEADSMHEYFKTVADIAALEKQGVKVFTEECSIISWQNISYSKDLLAAEKISPTKVTVFGDTARQEKLVAYATAQFNSDVRLPDSPKELLALGSLVTTIEFHGFNFGTKPEDDVQTVAEILSVYKSDVSNQVLEARISEWTEKFDYDVAANLVEKGCLQFKGF